MDRLCDDPTVLELEALSADMPGKGESSFFRILIYTISKQELSLLFRVYRFVLFRARTVSMIPFNSAAAPGVAVKELVDFCDSVAFCLSKGLAVPIGSMLAGNRDFMKEARLLKAAL